MEIDTHLVKSVMQSSVSAESEYETIEKKQSGKLLLVALS